MIISLNTKKRTNKSKLIPGEYDSVVTFFDFHPDYRAETAFLVKYKLTNAKGTVFNFSEIFFNDEKNKRTDHFFKYLEKNGITAEDFRDFQGCKEKLTLKKNPTRDGRIFLSITERVFIAQKAGVSHES